jgi:hypothetical protein
LVIGLGGVAHGVERVGVVRTSFGRPAISAMPPALSVTGPKASSATIMPASASMVGGAIGDAEQAGERVGDDDAGDDDQRRQRRRFHRDREALDDVGAVAGDRGLGDRVHRTEVGAGVVFGDPDDQRR